MFGWIPASGGPVPWRTGVGVDSRQWRPYRVGAVVVVLSSSNRDLHFLTPIPVAQETSGSFFVSLWHKHSGTVCSSRWEPLPRRCREREEWVRHESIQCYTDQRALLCLSLSTRGNLNVGTFHHFIFPLATELHLSHGYSAGLMSTREPKCGVA